MTDIKTSTSKDISMELRRTYTWGYGAQVVIERPVTLHVSEHGHRIADADGNGHYIPNGWVHLKWETKPGAAPLSF